MKMNNKTIEISFQCFNGNFTILPPIMTPSKGLSLKNMVCIWSRNIEKKLNISFKIVFIAFLFYC
jgi:hypothetical protein